MTKEEKREAALKKKQGEEDRLRAWPETEEGKAGAALLEKALRAYSTKKEHLMIETVTFLDESKNDYLEWRYYPAGGICRIPNPKYSRRTPEGRAERRFIVIHAPTVSFVTKGGQKRFYYAGFEETRAFKPNRMTPEQKDGIVRKEPKFLAT